MKYSTINIGPIISTFAMARKPRELWSASYLFSHLMKCIYKAIEDKHLAIISPDKPKIKMDANGKEIKNKIGIYPDRVFFKGECDIKDILESAKAAFLNNTGISSSCFDQYFNLMSVTIDSKEEDAVTNEATAIKFLNQELDVLELCNYAADHEASDVIRRLVGKKNNSPLFEMESGDKNMFPYDVNTLAEIATAELMATNPDKWDEIRNAARNAERKAEAKRNGKEDENDYPEDSIDIDESDFYKRIAAADVSEWKLKSHHKYFCIVQADGDNVGKTVSHNGLQDNQVKVISTALVEFGQKAASLIEGYGGLPIYAGGDDLLFIAPVIGKDKDKSNIFDLIRTIEDDAFKGVKEKVHNMKDEKGNRLKDDNNNDIEASLSFGIAISYYKYPLYEAFETARHQLFSVAKDKKRFPNKKAVAWSFRKHSGGTFDVAFSLKDTEKDTENGTNLQTLFNTLINATTDDNVVSAVAHKMREHEALVKTVMASGVVKTRLDYLFKNVLEFQDNDYFKAVKAIMPKFYKAVGENNFIPMLYSLLRTAKFIKGEDLHDE